MTTTLDAFVTLDINDNALQEDNGWPQPLLQQFDIKQSLGKGGQGSVYLAHEYQLQRDVAIKRIKQQPFHDTLLMEAQAQAKIDHPNISKLFQVIQTSMPHQPNYLVMQFISGQSALDWCLQQRKSCHNKLQWQQYMQMVVIMIQQVCDGLQALHSAGIIHRDIKPANIMLTTEHANEIHPYIVDFGLAQHNQHLDNSVSGSWPFMSPEQKQGKPLSNSSDIYSLGVTLYQLLTGQLPPQNQEEPLNTTIDTESNIELPIELTVIIKHCLAEDRQNRYQAAQMLKQELQRFLTGEPINSINSMRYKAKKKLIKHRLLAFFLSIIIAAAIAQWSWLQQQKLQQQAREQLIQQFHQTVQQAHYQSNLAYMAPPHDIRYLQQQHRQNLQQLIKQAEKLGETALPFALYAKGRISQQQGKHIQAQQQLESAWQQGFQTLDSAYALVQVLNTLYQQALTRLYIMPQGALRQAQQNQLQQQFVEPIINYLEFIQQQDQTSNAQTQQNYILALLDYYRQDYQQAIERLNKISQIEPWQYQHYLLLAQSYVAQYQQQPKSTQSKPLIEQAELAFDKAITIAPSDPNNYIQKWQHYITLASNRLFDKGDALGYLQNAEHLLEQAQQLNPNHLDTQTSMIRTQFQRMVYLFNQGKPWQTTLTKTEQLINTALAKWPQQPKLWRLLAKVLSRKLAHSQLDKTNLQYQHIDKLYQQLTTHQQLSFNDLIYYALHLKHWGDFIEDKATARAKYQAAAKLFKQAIASNPQYSGSYVNLALIQLKLSESDDNPIAQLRLTNAIEQLNSALNQGYSEFIAHYYLAKVRLEINNKIGSHNLTKAITELKAALTAVENALRAKPNNYHGIGLKIEILSHLIENQWYAPGQNNNQQLATELAKQQLDRLNNDPEQLLALAHSSYILALVIEKGLNLITENEQEESLDHIRHDWLQQQKQISQKLYDLLYPQLESLNGEPLTESQTTALSILIHAQMQTGPNNEQSLEQLISHFKTTAKSADHYWTLANFHRYQAKQQTELQQQVTLHKQAIELWQRAYQLNPNRIRYHYSLLNGYLQLLGLINNSNDEHLIESTIKSIKTLQQKLSNNTELYLWIDSALKQHQQSN